MPDIQAATNQDFATTTNASPTLIVQMELPENTSMQATARAIARRPSDGVMKEWTMIVAARRVGNGDAELVGAPVSLSTHANAAASLWTTSIDVDGVLVRISCTGAISATIDWWAQFDAKIMT